MANNFSHKSPISKMVIVQDIEFEDISLKNKEENNKQNNSINLKSKEIISLKLKNCDLDKKESFNQKSSVICDKKTNLIKMNENKLEESKDFNQKNLDQNLINNDVITCEQLSDFLNGNLGTNLLIDSRSFIEYNSCHIQEAINVCCSKIIKRRLQNDKTSVRELLNNMNIGFDVDKASIIVVYDQNSNNIENLPEDSCLKVLWTKLNCTFKNVKLLNGGFNEFHKSFKSLCTNKAQLFQNRQKKSSLDALSQPCLPNLGPTKILPFLYLGSQVDAMNKDLLKNHNITYELNVSTTCPKPDFIQESNFLRIPVNDNYSDKLLPYFPQAINFLDKVRESSGCVLVHCLGGISRSATVAIAYIMQHMKMTSEDAYRYLKGKRATISPNFNFLGQLLEYEKQLVDNCVISAKKNLIEKNLLKIKDKQDSLENDSSLQLPSTPNFDLNKKSFSSNSPKHHLLHHRFNSHLINLSSQEKNLNDSEQEKFSIKSLADTTVDVATNNSSSQFNIINSNTGNGSQKRTCSFNSSPNTRNKMTLKLPVNEKCDSLNSIVFL